MQPGTVLLEKYRVDRLLGEGGMGRVALAYHLQLRQPVAIKSLHPHVITNPDVVRRFLREAQAAVRLRSEHVARVTDVGTLHDGAPYMVMEYLEGQDLARMLRAGPVPAELAVDLMLQTCEAVAEAHALGIIHRDLKPANLFIAHRPDGSPLLKVLDFGISKTPAVDGGTLSSIDTMPPAEITIDTTAPTGASRFGTATQTHSVMGTPAYMSPEQMASSKNVDPRSDLWSLGVVFYEMLAGRRPFDSDSYASLCILIATEPAPPIGDAVPPALAAIVSRCLAKDPAQRYQDVAALAAALIPFASNPTVAHMSADRMSRVLGLPSTEPPSSSPALALAPTTADERPLARRRLRTAAIAGVAALAAGAATALFTGVGSPPAAAPPPAVVAPPESAPQPPSETRTDPPADPAPVAPAAVSDPPASPEAEPPRRRKRLNRRQPPPPPRAAAPAADDDILRSRQ